MSIEEAFFKKWAKWFPRIFKKFYTGKVSARNIDSRMLIRSLSYWSLWIRSVLYIFITRIMLRGQWLLHEPDCIESKPAKLKSWAGSQNAASWGCFCALSLAVADVLAGTAVGNWDSGVFRSASMLLWVQFVRVEWSSSLSLSTIISSFSSSFSCPYSILL